MTVDEIQSLVSGVCKHGEPVSLSNTSPRGFRIDHVDLISVCTALHENPSTYFDMLSCLTGIDNGAEKGTMEVVYTLYSIPYNLHLTLAVTLPREKPVIDSVSSIWKTADWHEREVFDMYGIVFTNHPDLRRILMPADWEGHPLRKDYQHQEYYRNIKVD